MFMFWKEYFVFVFMMVRFGYVCVVYKLFYRECVLVVFCGKYMMMIGLFIIGIEEICVV